LKMEYKEFVEVYEALAETAARLEKTDILAGFLKKLKKNPEWIYLLRGRVLPDYDSGEFGISGQLTIKAIARASGSNEAEIIKKFRKVGDLGEIAEELIRKKKQSTLYSDKLKVEKIFDNLRKVIKIEGKGAVDKKLGLVVELLTAASGKEAKYIVRTLLNDLRVGVADGTLRDAVVKSVDGDLDFARRVEVAYDLGNDWAEVFERALKGKRALSGAGIKPGKPIKVMLPVKVTEIDEAFRICGKPTAIEHKYDGFRMVISNNNGEIKLFTRRLENVTNQFPDVVSAIKGNVKGKSFILDAEVVGYDPKNKKYMPFEAISQRIKRKYEIDKLIKELPVEVNVFDVLYLNGVSLMDLAFSERRKKLEKIIDSRNFIIRPSFQIVTGSEKEASDFYKKALKIGEEGVMFKKLDAPYQAGRRVGFMVKMKPETKDLDFVIVGAEYGSGKRAGWLSSYILACQDNGEFLEVGKVSSGLKEKEEEGTSYEGITKLLKGIILSEDGKIVRVKPKLVVSVTYQNIQRSPGYSSGYALRFPRITNYRPDRNVSDITSLDDVKREARKER
jgi:DNA ligase 1